jgi:hypothetical protein
MDRYIGETVIIDLSETPFANYSVTDWALYFISEYGYIDGEHHKQWLLNQVAAILQGHQIIVREARWSHGLKEYRVSVNSAESFLENEGIAP